jgi:bromodomain adjacent to zinc finger domain protein 1A
MRELEYEFRAHIYTLRSRPFGVDRYGNKVWWMDGIGSAPLIIGGGGEGVGFGTGRIYLQGVEEEDLGDLVTLAEVEKGEVEARRIKEEGEGKLGPGEWGVYDTPEQVGYSLRTFYIS